MAKGLNILLLSLLSLLFASCAKTIESKIKEAEKIASFNSFEKKLVPAEGFVLTTYQRITDKYRPYVFYIEGDGSITSGHYSVASNPTPSQPMLLKLAALDPRPNIVYLARPCKALPVHSNGIKS